MLFQSKAFINIKTGSMDYVSVNNQSKYHYISHTSSIIFFINISKSTRPLIISSECKLWNKEYQIKKYMATLLLSHWWNLTFFAHFNNLFCLFSAKIYQIIKIFYFCASIFLVKLKMPRYNLYQPGLLLFINEHKDFFRWLFKIFLL